MAIRKLHAERVPSLEGRVSSTRTAALGGRRGCNSYRLTYSQSALCHKRTSLRRGSRPEKRNGMIWEHVWLRCTIPSFDLASHLSLDARCEAPHMLTINLDYGRPR